MCQHGGVQVPRTERSIEGTERWRWVAHPPFGAPGAPPSPAEAEERARARRRGEEFLRRSEPSPAYGRNPGWGLPRVAAGTGEEPAAPATRHVLDERLPAAARVAAVLGIVAALVGGVRYGLLVALRDHSVEWWIEALTAWATRFAFAAVFVAALVLLVAAIRALLAARGHAFASRGAADPRNTWRMAAGGVIPGVNLLLLPVYLREIEPAYARVDPRVWGRLRAAWWALGANELVGALFWWQLARPGTQAAANALALGALLAALLAVLAVVLARVARAASGGEPGPRWTASVVVAG